MRSIAVLASMAGDIITNNSKNTSEAYKAFVDCAFPFATKSRSDSDQELIERMRKEAEKGTIMFTPIAGPTPLQKAASKFQLPDEFRAKLQKNMQQRARRRA